MHPDRLAYFFMIKSLYFSHDYNAAQDVKCLFLRQQLGMEGYGIYWVIIEQLAQSGGTLPLKIIPVLAMQMQVTETKVNAVVTKFELFTISEQNFFSIRLKNFLKERKKISAGARQNAISRWNSKSSEDAPALPPQSDSNANKERKESKEIKEKKEIDSRFAPPSENEVHDYFISKLNTTEAEKEYRAFFSYYESNGWKVGKNKMKNWHAAAAGWISRMSNFKTENNGQQKLGTSAARMEALKNW